MRCPDCARMVSFDEPQATVEDEGISEDGEVRVEVRLVLPCAECGAELKENTFSFEEHVEHPCEEGKIKCICGHPFSEHKPNPMGCTHGVELKPSTDQEVPGNKEIIPPCSCSEYVAADEGFELGLDDPKPTEDFKPKTITNKKGEEKPVPMRYQKHCYGVQVSGTAICNKCGEEIIFELSVEIQSSEMDEC